MFKIQPSLCEENNGSNGGSATSSNDELDSLKAEVERLRNHSQKLLNEKKELQNSLKSFDGIDLDQIKNMMSQLESSEETKMLSEGKLDEVVARRTEKAVLAAEQRATEYEDNFKSLTEKFNSLSKKYTDSMISTEIRRQAEKSGVIPGAIDDVIRRLEGTFSVTEDGSIEARDSSGNLLTINKKPLDPALAVEKLKDDAPHLWPNSSSAGANGSVPGGFSGKNPFKRGEAWNLTEQSRLLNTNPELAKRLQSLANS